MKTAMQELIDEIRQQIIKSAQGKNLTNRTGEYRIGLTKAIELATEKLEKEKEQIIEARLDGFKISGEGWNGEYPFEGESCKEINTRIDNEGYYNQTYNQKKPLC